MLYQPVECEYKGFPCHKAVSQSMVNGQAVLLLLLQPPAPQWVLVISGNSPYIMGENGGGAFVLVYLLAILLIGIPVLMAEVLMGKRGRQSPGLTARTLVLEAHAHSFWQITGWIGLVAGFYHFIFLFCDCRLGLCLCW